MSANPELAPMPDLARYRVTGYSPGAGPLRRAMWYVVNEILFRSPLIPVSAVRRVLLRAFGARIGAGVNVYKPRINIKHPWRLSVGAHSWIGEDVWIDNLVDVTIGENVCVSQGALILTGNHDYTSATFELRAQPVRIEDGAWVGARAVVCPGVTLGRNSVLTVGSVLTRDAAPDGIYAGNPAQRVRERRIVSRE